MTAPLFNSTSGFQMLDQTPLHAWTDHPVLNPGRAIEDPTAFMDLGTIVHGCLLTGESNVALIDAPDWRTKTAKEQRDAARAAGKTPLLMHKWPEVQAMVQAARHQLERVELPTPFVGGHPESTLYFRLDGVECRCTPDWTSEDRTYIREYKSTGVSAHPGAFAKTIWGNGYAFQAALECRAVKAVYGVEADFAWVAQETYAPYALSMVSMDPEAFAFANHQVDVALEMWKRCLETGHWPGYSSRIAYAELPAWVQAQDMERSYYRADVPTG